MKKLILIIIIFSISGITSCKKALEEDLFTNPSFEGLNNLADVEAALTGAYAGLLGNKNGGYYGRDYMTLQEITADNLLGAGEYLPFDNFTYDANSSVVSNLYSDIYNMILRANLVIDNIDQASIPQEIKDKYKAEAKYLVALGYYDLSSLFGGVVLIKSSVNNIKDKPGRASLDEVEQFIFKNLDEAIPYLSRKMDENRPGAATVGAAYALKMKLALRRKEWSKVVDNADSVINLKQYGLLPDVKDLYKIGNSNNKEIIFSVKTSGEPQGSGLGAAAAGSTDIAIQNYDWNQDYYGFGVLRMELKFYYSFSPDDERFIKLFRHRYTNRSGQIVGPKKVNNTNTPGVAINQTFVYGEKYPHPDAGKGIDLRNDIYHANTLFVSRYAEVLLAKAEALNELNGPNQTSYDLINEVRFRANLGKIEETAATFTTETLRDAIFRERDWEFFMEGYRREDLIREGTFVSEITGSHFLPSQKITVHDYNQYYPIPAIEIQLNTNIDQNDY